MIVKISVTADDISKGVPEEACKCPVWLAISRALSGVRVVVSPDDVSLTRDDYAGVAKPRLPFAARLFICRFDHGGRVEPFEFDLDVPAEAHPRWSHPVTGRETGALIIIAGLVLLAIAVAGWLLRPAGGRHEQREQAAEREADTFVAELRGLPAPGKDYISDRTVRLPFTPPLGDMPGAGWQRPLWQPPWPPAPLHEPAAERLADTDVRATVTCAAPARPATMQPDTHTDTHTRIPPAGEIPEWVRAALGGHDGVDACVESIVARSETP